MIVTDLEHLEVATQSQEVEGGEGMFPGIQDLMFKAMSAFSFNTLATGLHGAFAGGEPKILTTAYPGNYSVGFQFTYTSVAVGLPALPL